MSMNESASSDIAFDDAIADLFDLDMQTEGIAELGGVGRSADCTNNGCTESCVSCGCR